MSQIQIWNALEFQSPDGTSLDAGSLDVPSVLTAQATPQVYRNELVLAQNAIGTLWDASVGPSDFTYAYITSDTGDGSGGWNVLELTTDENNSIGIKYATVALAAGIPFVLPSSASYANYGANFSSGTLSKIQKIKVKNLNSATATVRIRLVY